MIERQVPSAVWGIDRDVCNPSHTRTRNGFQMIVRLGHDTVEVKATDRAEAIKQARRLLCERWPRLWDVIMGKPEGAFDVT